MYPPVPNTNTIVPICPQFSHLEGSNCVRNGVCLPARNGSDDGAITCSPIPGYTPPLDESTG